VNRVLLLAAAGVLLAGCGSGSKPASSESQAAETTRPADETSRFPAADRVSTEVVDNHLLNKSFLPGGAMAHYKKGQTAYDMFVVHFPTATDAAIALANLEAGLQSATVNRDLGSYFGTDAGRPLLVQPKDRWIAGVIGLPQAEAEQAARALLARLN
jgi:PBP1b-binding outer membrane lipoprotein LpoB